MITLALTILLLIISFMVMRWNPMLAGLIAVIPIKILGAGFMAFELGGSAFLKVVEGMLIGQFIWGFALLGLWVWIKYT